MRRGRCDAPLVFSALPSEVPFGFVGRLLPPSIPSELRLQLHRVPAERAFDLLERAQAVAGAELAAGAPRRGARPSELEREVDSAERVAKRVAAREQELWRVGLSVHAIGASPTAAERSRTEIVRRFRAAGFRPRIPSYEASNAARAPDLLGTEPRPRDYWHTLPTDGASAFFPYVEEAIYEPSGVLVGILLDDASPVFLDRWSHSSYSWGIFGATGAGKTFYSALLALRTRWTRPDLELIFLDPLGEFSGLARALGGSVPSVADGRSGHWNPLDPTTTGGDRAEKSARVSVALKALFPSLRDEESAVLDTSVRRLFDSGPEVPTFSDLLDAVPSGTDGSGRLPALLEVFRSGSLRHLDGPTTSGWGEQVTSINLLGVPANQLAFHVSYLLDAAYGRLRSGGHPKLLVIDEAHLFFQSPETSSYLDKLVRHLRHYDAGVLLISQNPDDLLHTESGRSMARNLRASVLLRLSEVSEATRTFFGLTESEATWLPRARLPKETGYSEALLRFGSAHLPIAAVASTPEYEFLREALADTDRAQTLAP